MELADAASRRRFLKHAAFAACASVIAPSLAKSEEPPRQSFQRVVDLTHTLSASFPLTWPNPFVMEQVSKLGRDKWNAYRWHLQEHSGTHWLNQSKWGLENVAGLGQLPARGATIVVGAPKIAGSTGGPSRVLALL